MSVCTCGTLNKNVKPIEIFNVILQEFDKNATYHIKKDKIMSDFYNEDTYSGRIYFEYKDENRSLFYCETKDHSELYKGGIHGNISLGCNKNSEDIIVTILKYFGGYYDYNDCDDINIEDTYIPKDKNFKMSDYVKKINEIFNTLDLPNKDMDFKIIMAKQIYNNKKKIIKLLND